MNWASRATKRKKPRRKPGAATATACPTQPWASMSPANAVARIASSAPTSAFRCPAAPAAQPAMPLTPRPTCASYREAGSAAGRSTAESAALYQSASAALATWQASRNAAESLTRAAEMTARAYQLGEGSLNELLAARRLANEAQLAARLLQLEALELRYRLLLDAHLLWDFD
jgi:hypothetical protein